MSRESPSILLLAGEPSGDQHAAAVARALKIRWPHCSLVGTGGEHMAAEGVELIADLADLAVMGFVEVLSRLPFFWRLERRVVRRIESGEFDLVLPVDYPGFNLRITERSHAAGVPVLYYIAPQVWAWKPGRTARLSRTADRVAVILPFEEEIFRREGCRADFVGHPLLDRDDGLPSRAEFCRSSNLDPEREILALLPGSRSQEIRRHLEPFVGAAEILATRRSGLQAVLARAPNLELRIPEDSGVVAVDDARALFAHARGAIVKSGTSTLEAALAGTPFVVAYRTHPWTYRLARRLVRVEHVALANLVAGERVVPELLQDDVTSEALADAVEPMLGDTKERERVLHGLGRIRERLGSPGAAERVAALAQEVLGALGGDRSAVGSRS